ncbi:DUF2303 family protein [Sphingomonas sp.]|uniref:DUF2303 family protein n=1 Tax=Sphingomonas sp. TaxID=28214 RepID=UPI0028AFACCA|nr:DUF2303 family protein [Sphingomonas sp.]
MDYATTSGGEFVQHVRTLVEDYVKADVYPVKDPASDVEALVVQSGNSVTPLDPKIFDPYRAAPRFRHGTAVMLSLDSLIAHVNRFKDTDSVVFANDDRVKPSLTAVLDYHRDGAEADPRFGKHRSIFEFPLSDEWKAWAQANDEKMTMAEFAAFLENRIIDVLYLIPGEDTLPEDLQRLVDTLGGPETIATPNKLMELARGLQVNDEAIVQEAVNLSSGEGVVRFQARHTDEHGAPLKVPSLFLIAIPVFRNGPLYRLAARLRYRAAQGRLTFWFELWRTDRTFDHAFSESLERVRVETALPVFVGKPEA